MSDTSKEIKVPALLPREAEHIDITKKYRLVIVPPQGRAGYAAPLKPTLLETVKTRLNSKTPAAQFYLAGQTFDECDILASQTYLESTDHRFYVHSPLNTNLADKGYIGDQTVNCLAGELKFVAPFPAQVVIHIGRVGKNRTGNIENIVTRLDQMNTTGDLPRGKLLLEVAAGKSGELGSTWKDIRKIYEALDTNKIQLTLDTQHVFASGMSALSSYDSIVKTFDRCQERSGYKVALVHLNDSKVKKKSQNDRHAPLSTGYVWKANTESLGEFIKYCDQESIDMVTETSAPLDDAKLIKSLRRVNEKSSK